MTKHEQRAMIDRLMAREGGFTDHPVDSGGPTKYGITLATLEAARGVPVSAGDVRNLGKDEAADIYDRLWASHPRLRLNEWPYRRLAEVTLDAAVMFALGRSMSVKWVQEACNRRMPPGSIPLEVDGWAGVKTQFAMVRHSEGDLISDVIASRVMKHARVVAATPSQVVFLVGWCSRAIGWLQKGVTYDEPSLSDAADRRLPDHHHGGAGLSRYVNLDGSPAYPGAKS